MIFERGEPENLRLMKTRLKIFQPKTKSVFGPKLGEDQKKGLHSNFVRFLAKKRSSPTVSGLKPSAQVKRGGGGGHATVLHTFLC